MFNVRGCTKDTLKTTLNSISTCQITHGFLKVDNTPNSERDFSLNSKFNSLACLF